MQLPWGVRHTITYILQWIGTVQASLSPLRARRGTLDGKQAAFQTPSSMRALPPVGYGPREDLVSSPDQLPFPLFPNKLSETEFGECRNWYHGITMPLSGQGLPPFAEKLLQTVVVGYA